MIDEIVLSPEDNLTEEPICLSDEKTSLYLVKIKKLNYCNIPVFEGELND